MYPNRRSRTRLTRSWPSSREKDFLSDERRRARLVRAAIARAGPIEPDDQDWAAWVTLAVRERAIPQLYAASIGPSAHLSEERLGMIGDMQLDVARMAVRLEQRLLEVAELFHENGIEFAVLKGAATSHLDYSDPSERQFGDIDVLVGPDDFPRSREVLERAGWRHSYALPRHHERFAHALTFRDADGRELDLHQHIAHRALGLVVPTAALLESTTTFSIAGRAMRALRGEDRLIHAALHAIASRGRYRRLSSVADVIVLAEKLHAESSVVFERSERWRIRSLVEAAISDAYREAMLRIPEAWIPGRSRATSHLMGVGLIDYAYLGPSRRLGAEELVHLRHLPSWRDRLLYAYGHLRVDHGKGSGGLRHRLRYLRSRLREGS